ncbi:hypothetical protein [Fimbriiglobus ruber]|uniref:Uncharacterized protein n=1 Tax=Fimbriiglobus ruber TaxID=1908690 RepID=A0A225DH88_9BACT|nr:hypothetical protein [Fimbriiglobus ruber]OWK40792.1 hypothetical protein FRUB_04684 [Fimbriiglobus ruber]
MRPLFALLAAAVVAASAVPARAAETGLEKGTPALKSVSALAFSPDGILFIGDSQAGTIYAVGTDDTKSASAGDVAVDNLGDKVGSALGTTAANVTINDVKVNPASGNIYLAVTRGKGAEATPVIARLDRTSGNVAEFPLKDVPCAKVTVPNAVVGNKRQEAFTSLAFVDGRVIVAGLSNEEFASTLRALPFPFKDADKGTSVEIFHGAHGKLETQAPVRTFVAYKISGADYLLAAYTCTPLVKVPLADLKPGQKVKGTTIAELGNGNRPLDMIVYNKDGKDYILLANDKRGVMKILIDGFDSAEPITARPKGATAGVKYETIKELTGVLQLDKLDAGRALVLAQAADKTLSLKSVPLP